MRLVRSPLALVVMTAIVSGCSVYINDLFVAKIDPSLFTLFKNTVVALLLGAIILGTTLRSELKRLTRVQWIKLAVIGLVGGSLPFLLFFWGLSLTSGTMGAFLHKSLFIPVAILAAVVLRERPNALWICGAVLLMIGNAILLRVNVLTFTLPHFLILGAVLLWAVENVISKSALKELSGTVVAFGRMGFGALFILFFLAVSGELMNVAAILNTSNVTAIAVSSLLLLVYVLTWYNGLRGMRVSDAACILLLASPITLLLATFAQHKAITVPQVIGVLLLLEGLVIILSATHRSQFPRPANR